MTKLLKAVNDYIQEYKLIGFKKPLELSDLCLEWFEADRDEGFSLDESIENFLVHNHTRKFYNDFTTPLNHFDAWRGATESDIYWEEELAEAKAQNVWGYGDV